MPPLFVSGRHFCFHVCANQSLFTSHGVGSDVVVRLRIKLTDINRRFNAICRQSCHSSDCTSSSRSPAFWCPINASLHLLQPRTQRKFTYFGPERCLLHAMMKMMTVMSTNAHDTATRMRYIKSTGRDGHSLL